MLGSLGRALAMLLLPASILPVLVFGPQLVRAPEKLWREGRAEVQRLSEHQAPTARRRATAVARGPRVPSTSVRGRP